MKLKTGPCNLTALAWTAAGALVVAACGGSTDSSGTEQQSSPDGGATGGGGSTSGAGGSSGSGGGLSSTGAGGGAGSSAAGGAGSSSAGGSSGSAGSGGASNDGGPSSCDSNLKSALVKDCQSETDCALVHHNDCCGTVVIAVKKGTEAGFPAKESAFQSCVPGCGLRGCFHADMAEDRKPASAPGQMIVAICDNKMCRSTFQ
jgi:hypothetical protein